MSESAPKFEKSALSVSDFSETLQEHIVRVDPGSAIDFESVAFAGDTIKETGLTQKEVESLLETVVGYLNSPTIIDDFSGHQERREWRKGLDSSDLERIDKNKLRINVINSVLARIDFIEYMHQEKSGALTDFLNKINTLKDSLPLDATTQYGEATLEDKIRYRDAFEQFAKEIIKELSARGLISGVQI